MSRKRVTILALLWNAGANENPTAAHTAALPSRFRIHYYRTKWRSNARTHGAHSASTPTPPAASGSTQAGGPAGANIRADTYK
jgi:hypothetical protein